MRLTYGAHGTITNSTMSSIKKNLRRVQHPTYFRPVLAVAILATIVGWCPAPGGRCEGLTIKSDANDSRPTSFQGRAGNKPEAETQEPQDRLPESAGPRDSRQDQRAAGKDQTALGRSQELRRIALERLQDKIREEAGLMRSAVQIMDADPAGRWLAGFISAQPLNCSVKQQNEWIDAIILAAQRNDLPICKEILALTACIISIESGFNADPPAVDPGGGEDMSAILDRAEQKLQRAAGPLLLVPPLPGYYAAYKARYHPRLLACRTEGEVEVVARSIATDLEKQVAILPDFLKDKIRQGIEKLRNIVRTKGSMQLNFSRARAVLTERGERFTDQELCDHMYTVRGGVDGGVATLKPMFVQYAARYAVPGDLSWLFFVGMDYHYGPFSSRNMMEQIRIRDLSGIDIALDGDFLHYDERGRPLERQSQTRFATEIILPDTAPEGIFEAFLLEKDPHYICTEVHRSIAAAHLERFGETPFAVIGDLWMGEKAFIKHGTLWKTRSYLRNWIDT